MDGQERHSGYGLLVCGGAPRRPPKTRLISTSGFNLLALGLFAVSPQTTGHNKVSPISFREFIRDSPRHLSFHKIIQEKGQMRHQRIAHNLIPQKEVCSCCSGTGICTDLFGDEESCLTCNGRGHFTYFESLASGCYSNNFSWLQAGVSLILQSRSVIN